MRKNSNKSEAQLEFKQLAARIWHWFQRSRGRRKKFEKLDRELRDLNKTVGDGLSERLVGMPTALESLSSTANTVKGCFGWCWY